MDINLSELDIIWVCAAAFMLGSLTSLVASCLFAKYITGSTAKGLIFATILQKIKRNYRNAVTYDAFFRQPRTRPSTACIAVDAGMRRLNQKTFLHVSRDSDQILDKNSKYYYLKIRNRMNMPHNLPPFMDKPNKVTISENWNDTKFELNGYLYTYPGCSLENGLIMYVHGGAFILGTYTMQDRALCIYMQKLGCCVLALDYQLCPEVNGVPNQVNQCVDAYKYIINKANIDYKKVFIMGESAGASLTLLTAQKINDLKLEQPCGAVLISLVADLSLKNVIERQEKYDFEDAVLPRSFIDCGSELLSEFLVNDDDRKIYNGNEIKILGLPSYSPINGNFKGLCPIYLSASENEILIDESKAILEKCRQNNVSVQYLWDECLPHATVAFASLIPEARDSLIIITEWMKKQLKQNLVVNA